jgi:medium-chain acyl-[acyl-carrier-protein] hydrolase
MGAMLGFELAVELARRKAAHPPQKLILSGCNPPHIPLRVPPLHQLPEPEMLALLQERYGNLPAELLADRSFLELITPVIRADFAVVANYVWRGSGPADRPLIVLGGTSDPETTPAELIQWDRHTRAGCRVQMFPGDHFFNQQRRDEVLALIKAELAGIG